MTVRDLLRSLDSAELTEWRAYFELEAEADRQEVDDDTLWRKAFNA